MKKLNIDFTKRKLKAPLKKDDPDYVPIYPIKLSKEVLTGKRKLIVRLPKKDEETQ